MDPSTQTILITGASGHAGAHILLAFLARGYAALAAVRSQPSASKVSRMLAAHATPAQQSRVSFAIVPDITAGGAFDAAVRNADGVIHVASPVRPAGGTSDVVADILDPAVAGTLNLLDAARSHGPRVRRVVVTGSMAAVIPFGKSVPADYVFTEEDWMDVDRDVAVRSGHPGLAYAASKVLAERAALEYGAQRQGLRFGVVTVVPPSIFGPQVNGVGALEELNLTPAAVYRLVSGELAGKEAPPMRLPTFVDARDLAEAHVRAFEVEGVEGGRRYLVCGDGCATGGDVVKVVRERLPELEGKLPVSGKAEEGKEGWRFSNERVKRELGMVFRGLEETVVDTVECVLRLEKELKG